MRRPFNRLIPKFNDRVPPVNDVVAEAMEELAETGQFPNETWALISPFLKDSAVNPDPELEPK